MLKESENIEGEKIEESEGRYSNSLLGILAYPEADQKEKDLHNREIPAMNIILHLTTL